MPSVDFGANPDGNKKGNACEAAHDQGGGVVAGRIQHHANDGWNGEGAHILAEHDKGSGGCVDIEPCEQTRRRKRYVDHKDKGMALIANIVLAAACLFAWFAVDLPEAATYALGFFTGCVLGAVPTAFFAIPTIAARSKGTIGAATAVIVLGQNMGTLVIPTVVGMVLDASGYHMAAMAMGGVSVVALVIALVWRALYNKREAAKAEI